MDLLLPFLSKHRTVHADHHLEVKMPPKATRSPRVKREAISLSNGLITPNISMSSTNINDTPFVIKNSKEDASIKLSSTPAAQDSASLVERQSPVNIEVDEGYSTQALTDAEIKRRRRSESRKWK